MRNKLLLSVSVALMIGVGIYFNTTKDPNEAEPSESVSLAAPSAATAALAESEPQTSTSEAPANESLQEKINKYKTDKGAEYREELAKDPHQTPDVAIHSALELGEIFDKVKTESEAKQAFEFFSNCVSKESIVALQTSCLRYAKRLSDNYSSLQSLWPSLEASASNEAKDILKFDKR